MRGCLAGARTVLLFATALAGSGCVGARGYFADRWADTKDIFTASVGTGGGAKARVGPIQVGVFLNSDIAGLRGGDSFYLKGSFGERRWSCLDLVSPIPVPCGVGSDIPIAMLLSSDDEFMSSRQHILNNAVPLLVQRGKSYSAGCVVPFVAIGNKPYYYTQIEVAAGVGGTLRLGFNPGELLDFVLGWFNIDIFSDDLEARREREEKKKAKEKPKEVPPPAAPPAPPASQPGSDGTTGATRKKEVKSNGR